MRMHRSHRRPAWVHVLAAILTPALLAAVLPALIPGPVRAQSAASGAQSTFLDPSIRSSGMGRAAVAVFWGGDPDDWANPSLLAQRRGLRYEWGRTRLVPDLADDVHFTTNRLTLGAWGIGLAFVGKPFHGLGKLRLDYGESVATDVDGNVIGAFHSFEEIRSIGFGVSLLTLFENVARGTGGEPPALSRFADVSIGHSWKSVVVDLAPAGFTQDGLAGRDEARTGDTGVLLRVTPFNTLDGASAATAGTAARLDLAAGWSALNDDGARISFIDPDQADPIVRDSRLGFALHASLDAAGAAGRRSGLSDLISPLVSFGATWERSRYSWRSHEFGGEVKRWGAEVTLVNVASLRYGHVDDPVGTVQDDTWGVGLGVTYRHAAGIRYDFASVPQSKYLKSRVDRHGVTAFVDPFRLWAKLR